MKKETEKKKEGQEEKKRRGKTKTSKEGKEGAIRRIGESVRQKKKKEN